MTGLMQSIEPDMVLGKRVVDARGGRLGEIVDVGLYTHSRVKFLVVLDKTQRVPIRRYAVDTIDNVSEEYVTVHLDKSSPRGSETA
jgi:hypothetical protein